MLLAAEEVQMLKLKHQIEEKIEEWIDMTFRSALLVKEVNSILEELSELQIETSMRQ